MFQKLKYPLSKLGVYIKFSIDNCNNLFLMNTDHK